MIWLVVIGVVVVFALFSIAVYNGLVRARQQTRNAWSQIDVQLKRRYDLVPNLVETAKAYMKHEQQTLEAVVKARQLAINASTVADQSRAENMLTASLRSLFAVSENYPDLKANENMLRLQEELTSTENRIGFARQGYNDSVASYNTRVESFPGNLFAGLGGFKMAEYFELEDRQERDPVKVQF